MSRRALPWPARLLVTALAILPGAAVAEPAGPPTLLRSPDWSRWVLIPFEADPPRGALPLVGLCGERWSLDGAALAPLAISAAEADRLRLTGLAGADPACQDPILERWQRACPDATIHDLNATLKLLESLSLQHGAPRLIAALDAAVGGPDCGRPLERWLPARLARPDPPPASEAPDPETAYPERLDPEALEPETVATPPPATQPATPRGGEGPDPATRAEAIARLERLVVQRFQWEPTRPDLPETVLRLGFLYAEDARALSLAAQAESEDASIDILSRRLEPALARLDAAVAIQTTFLDAWPQHPRRVEARVVYASLLDEQARLLSLAGRDAQAERRAAEAAGVWRALVRDHPESEAAPRALYQLGTWSWERSNGDPGARDTWMSSGRRALVMAATWPPSVITLSAGVEVGRLLRHSGKASEATTLLLDLLERARQDPAFQAVPGQPDPLLELLQELVRCLAEGGRIDEALAVLAAQPDPETAFTLHRLLARALETSNADQNASGDAALTVYRVTLERFPDHPELPALLGERLDYTFSLARYEDGLRLAADMGQLVGVGSAWREKNSNNYNTLYEANRQLTEHISAPVDALVSLAEDRATSPERRRVHLSRAAALMDTLIRALPPDQVSAAQHAHLARLLAETDSPAAAARAWRLTLDLARDRGEPARPDWISAAYDATARWVDQERRASGASTPGPLTEAERQLLELTGAYVTVASTASGADALRATALVLVERGETRSGLQLLEEALRHDPDGPKAGTSTCELLAGLDTLGDWTLSVDVLGRLEATPGLRPELAAALRSTLDRARYLRVQGQDQGACPAQKLALYRGFADEHPDSRHAPRALVLAAESARTLGEPALAEALLRRALVLSLASPPASDPLAGICAGSGAAPPAAERPVDLSEIRRLLALNLELSLRWDEAAAAWREAALADREAPRAPEALARASELYEALGDARHARESLMELYALQSTGPPGRWSALKLGDTGAVQSALPLLVGVEQPDERLAEATLEAMMGEARALEAVFLARPRPKDPETVKVDFAALAPYFSAAMDAYKRIVDSDIDGFGLSLRMEAEVRRAALIARLAEDLLAAPAASDLQNAEQIALNRQRLQEEVATRLTLAREALARARALAADRGVYPPALEAPELPDALSPLTLPPLERLLPPAPPLPPTRGGTRARMSEAREALAAAPADLGRTSCDLPAPPPRAPALLDELAAHLLAEGEPTLARRVVEARLLGWPERPPAALATAIAAELAEGRSARAALDLAEARLEAPEDPWLALLQARLALGARDAETARALLDLARPGVPETLWTPLSAMTDWALTHARWEALRQDRDEERLRWEARNAEEERAAAEETRAARLLERAAGCADENVRYFAEALTEARASGERSILEEANDGLELLLDEGACGADRGGGP